jgi:membrane glycosyltransferase
MGREPRRGHGVLLFLPKVTSVFLVPLRAVRKYGGEAKLVASVAGEIVVSALLAPIRMLFHTRFVVAALLGRAVGWKSPSREDTQTTWREALQRHGLQTRVRRRVDRPRLLARPAFVWWLAPVAGALALSIPLSVYTSRASLGEPRATRGTVPHPGGNESAARDRGDAALHAQCAAAPRPGSTPSWTSPSTR